jgi:predicted dehydrogenase
LHLCPAVFVTCDDVKTVALIGCGYWGPNLLRNYADIPAVDLKWVCDTRPGALDRVQRRYPAIQTTAHLDDVLGDPTVDAVLVATPISTHHELARAALLAGKHVFVEKPLTSSVAQCVDLMALAAERDLTLMVGHTFIYSPPVRKVRELIDSGELGEVRFVTMQRVNLGLHQKDVSVIWDLAAHDLSILDYWLGEMPQAVGTMGRDCMRDSIPDVAFLSLQYGSGVVASIHVSWLSPVKLRRTMVVGERKMLVYDDTEPVEKVKVFDHGAEFKEPESFAEFQMTYHTGDIVSPKLDTTEPLRLEAEHFLRCVGDGHEPLTDGAMGARVVAALEAADASLREGVRKAIDLPHRSPRPDALAAGGASSRPQTNVLA